MEKILAVIGLTQRIYGRYLFRHLLSGMILLAGLTVISSIMVCAVVMGGFYALYVVLQHYGIAADNALAITAAAFTLATAMLVALTMFYLRRLRDLPRHLIKQSPLGARASDTVDAFMAGFMKQGPHFTHPHPERTHYDYN